MTVSDNIANVIRDNEGMHYLNSPHRGKSLFDRINGEVSRLRRCTSDDPALLALDYLDSIPRIAGYLIELEKWCVGVRDATPDQLIDYGAQ